MINRTAAALRCQGFHVEVIHLSDEEMEDVLELMQLQLSRYLGLFGPRPFLSQVGTRPFFLELGVSQGVQDLLEELWAYVRSHCLPKLSKRLWHEVGVKIIA